MKLLIFRDSYETLVDELASRTTVEPLIMEADGTVVSPDGDIIAAPEPEAAWLSLELFEVPGVIRDFLRATLGSPDIKWVQSAAAGYENPLFQRVLDAGIRFSISDGNSAAIAEYVVAQVFACFHPQQQRREAQDAREWRRLNFREVHGTRWVMLGYGSIARNVARRVQGMGASVVGIRRTPQPDDYASRVVGLDQLTQEVREADVLVVSAAANDGNHHIVDADLLAAMKPDAVLVNVARGSLLDEAALLASLDAGRPGQAVLDVTDVEPLPAESPLWTHPQVRLTAHCSQATTATLPRGREVFLEHLDAWLAGAPLRLEIKPD